MSDRILLDAVSVVTRLQQSNTKNKFKMNEAVDGPSSCEDNVSFDWFLQSLKHYENPWSTCTMLLRRSRSLPKVSRLCENQRDLLCGLFRLGSGSCSGGSTLGSWSLLGVARGRTTFCRGLRLGLGGRPQCLVPESAPISQKKRRLGQQWGHLQGCPGGAALSE